MRVEVRLESGVVGEVVCRNESESGGSASSAVAEERSGVPHRRKPKCRNAMPCFLQNAVRLGEGSSAVSDRMVRSCSVRKKEWFDGVGVAER